MKYVYPAVFYRAIEGGYCIEFPDVEGAVTQANDLYNALEMAEDVLACMMVCWEDFKAGKLDTPMKNRIVEPTPIDQVKAEPDEFSTSAFVTLIKADTDAYRKMLAEKVPASKGAA
ncbi:MAG: type II toxin-antitoxin system HicB family antitoxin [Selenomonadaceae bacterium]|nr:type II toxin-antitoxin system HicB family antitoxin [Selenomonadaceae bacterium]